MPIDPMIPLMGKPAQINTPFQLEEGAAQIQGLQTQNAMRQTMLQDELYKQQARNALMEVYSPQNLDAKTHLPTESALSAYTARFPEPGNALTQHIQTQLQHKALMDKEVAETKRINMQNQQALMGRYFDLTATQQKAYDDELKNVGDPQKAQAAAVKAGMDKIDTQDTLGLLGEKADMFRQFVPKFDRVQSVATMNTAKMEMEKEKRADSSWSAATSPSVPNKQLRVNDKTGEVQIRVGPDDWQPWGGTTNDLRLVKQVSPEAYGERTRAVEAAKHEASPGLHPEVVNYMARQAWAGDKSVFQNLGRGAQGAKNIEALRSEIARIGVEEGRTPEELAAKNAEFYGITAGERTLGTRQANIDMAVTEAKNLIPLALKASEEAKRTGIKTVNDLQQFAQGKTASPELRKLAVATNGLINVYARAISPQGVPTISDKDHAREILDKAFASGDYESAVNQMMLEMEQAQKSPGQVRKDLRGSITGKEGGAANSPVKITTDAEYDALPSGTIYQPPEGPARRKP